MGDSVDDLVDFDDPPPYMLSLVLQDNWTQYNAPRIESLMEHPAIDGSNLSAEIGVASHAQIPSVAIHNAESPIALPLASANSPLQAEEDCSLVVSPKTSESSQSVGAVVFPHQHLTLPSTNISASSPFSVSSEGSEDHSSSHQVTEEEWRARKDELHRLYMTENLPLREIMEIFGQRQFFPTQVHEFFSARWPLAYT